MDVYCPRCGEPYELLGITDDFTQEERSSFWDGKGCPCCKGKTVESKPFRAEATAVLRDILGDDIDGIASELDDMEYMEPQLMHGIEEE